MTRTERGHKSILVHQLAAAVGAGDNNPERLARRVYAAEPWELKQMIQSIVPEYVPYRDNSIVAEGKASGDALKPK